jgi:hypothetical protein
MKLKTLSIVAAVLAVASIATWLFKQRDSGPTADARVGQPLLAEDVVGRIGTIRLQSDGRTVALVDSGTDGSSWVVRDYHDMPVDFSKLTRFVTELRDARVLRFVSANPERIGRMEFGDASIEILDRSGATVWSAQLGKTPDGGGRFVRFPDSDRAYLTGLNTWLDTTAKNWADANLVSIKPEDVTAIELGFPDGDPLVLTRPDGTSSWKVEGLAEGETLKSSPVSSLLSSLGNLRFTETTALDAPEAVAAREHARTIKLTTADRTYTIALGREPAPPAPPPPPPPSEGETAPPPPPAPKAGPVFASVTTSVASDPVNSLMEKRAFQISEWTFTNLPADRSALIEAPPPPPPPAAEGDAATTDVTIPPGPKSFADAAAEKAFLDETFEGFTTTASGIRYKVVKTGSGEKPAAGTRIQAHYAGRLLDGTPFDSSYERGEPFAFTLGQGQVIKGWDETLLDMRKGEKRTVVIPYALGYGERGAGADIPARATLVFDIELVDF